MPRPQPGPFFLQLPFRRPIFQRRYTASPPRHHDCTPPVAHGFIPLGTSAPLPTTIDREGEYGKADCFTLPLILSKQDGEWDAEKGATLEEVNLSPHTTTYEPHGFIPLCSVAVIESDDEASDYFSHPVSSIPPVEVNNLTPPLTISPDTPSPRFHGFIRTTIDVPIEELTHPTGSPLQQRDLVLSPENAYIALNLPPSGVRLRGGGIQDPQEDLAEAERQRCGSTGTSPEPDIEDTTSIQDDQDNLFQEALARLERSGLQSNTLNTPGPSISEYSASEYSNAEHGMDQDSIHQPKQPDEEQITLTEALALSDTTWQKVAETTALPDGSDMDDSEVDDNEIAGLSQSRGADITIHIPGASGHHDDGKAPRMQSIMEKEEAVSSTPYPPKSVVPAPETPHSQRLQFQQSQKQTTIPTHSARENTLFKIALLTPPKALSKCLTGPTLTITNGTTRETYASNVPSRMLLHFCGPAVIERLTPAYTSTSASPPTPPILEIPSDAATPLAIARIIRYMKRICSATTHKVSDEMRIPHNILDGLETIRACRVLALLADARRIEKLIAREWMANTIFDTSSSTLSLIWSAYFGTFRESEIGDGIVWFVLNETHKDAHGLAEEMWVLLEEEEFLTLKMRVREEVVGRCWRGESRGEFLDRCARERERLVRRRERRERKELERVERIESIREMNRREAPGLRHEAVASTSKGWKAPESWFADSGSVEAKSKGSAHSLVDDKPLPLPPGGNQVQSGSPPQTFGISEHEQQVDPVSVLYADAARSVSRFKRPVYDKEGAIADTHTPRLVPVPKKKRGTLGKILTALSG